MTVKRRESRYKEDRRELRPRRPEKRARKIKKNELIAVLLLRVRAEDELSVCTP